MNRFRDEDVLRFSRAAAEPDPASILAALIHFSGAERGFIVLGEGDPTAQNLDVAEAREKVSLTLLKRALSEKRPVTATDADLAGIESLRGQKVRSVCVLPLAANRGAVYLDHGSRKDCFGHTGDLQRLADALDAALRGKRELEELRARHRASYGGFVGASKPMRELYRVLERVAAAPYPVLLFGESGTGKELAARAIHRDGPRAEGPFVAANCAALPEHLVDAELFGHAKGAFTGADRDRPGLFEQAHGGVLFLDEIACLSAGAQESFLRALESGEVRRIGGTKTDRVDVRVVAATNEDLEFSESFRRDLFYRLNVLRVDLPPLRSRAGDVPLLAEHFLERVEKETGLPRKKLSKTALAALSAHPWPGNVRELENALRRAAALSDSETLEASDFGFLKAHGPAGGEIVSVEDHIRDVLVRWSGKMDVKEIADRLGLSRKTLWERKRKFGL